MAGAIQDVDPVVGVAGVDKDFFVLFVPMIYLIPYLLTTLGYGFVPLLQKMAPAE